MEFLYNNGRIKGRSFSVTFPNEMNIQLFDAMRPAGILHFVKRSDEPFHIEIVVDKAEGQLTQKEIELYIDDLGCEVDEILPIEKDGAKGYASFYHSSTADYYEEWFRGNDNGELFDLQFCVWTDLIDYPEICKAIYTSGSIEEICKAFTRIPVKRILVRTEVKSFFASIKVAR